MRRHLEFAVVVAIIATLALWLLPALEAARAQIEEARVQMEVTAIRTELLEILTHRETWGGQLPASNNPIDWVDSRPATYRGTFSLAPEETGIWYFDAATQLLVYHFQDGRRVRYRLGGAATAVDAPARLGGIGLWQVRER